MVQPGPGASGWVKPRQGETPAASNRVKPTPTHFEDEPPPSDYGAKGRNLHWEYFYEGSVQRGMKRWILPLLLLSLSVFSACADGLIVIERPIPGPPQPWPHPLRYVFAPLEVAYHHVTVKIDGQVATTSVDEDF